MTESTSSPTGQAETEREALRSIEQYGTDTLSGPSGAAADVAWYRDSVREMRNRARAALATAAPAPKPGEPPGWFTEIGSMLRNLLARIHGDGGQYLAQHGLDKAVEDADAIVARLLAGVASKPPAAVSDERIVACLVKAHATGTTRMTYESGPYDITLPTVAARAFAEALLAESGAPATHPRHVLLEELRAALDKHDSNVERACSDHEWDETAEAVILAADRLLTTHEARAGGEQERDARRWRHVESKAYEAVIPHGNKIGGRRTAWITPFFAGDSFAAAIDAAMHASNRASPSPESTPAGAEVQGQAASVANAPAMAIHGKLSSAPQPEREGDSQEGQG